MRGEEASSDAVRLGDVVVVAADVVVVVVAVSNPFPGHRGGGGCRGCFLAC